MIHGIDGNPVPRPDDLAKAIGEADKPGIPAVVPRIAPATASRRSC